METMDWKKLLSDKRKISRPTDGKDVRSEFEKDADRIFFSYPFRRLQNKTQVIPVPVYDFIHTRLTHSLEVATIGNSLGRMVGKEIIKRYKLQGVTDYDFGAIVKAACLAHDLGNPPFGHSGEESVRDFFKGEEIIEKFGNHFIEANLNKELNEKRWSDFQIFEGNAMGFRIITNEHYHGFNLTYATLATFTKYPRESVIDTGLNDSIRKDEKIFSLNKEKEWEPTYRASQKKFGFFQSEKNKFMSVAGKDGVGLLYLGNEENLSYCRHPLAFLVEAADDICYTLMDLEDAYRVGKVEEKDIREWLTAITEEDYERDEEYEKLSNKEQIGYLRGKAIFRLVDETARLFLVRENEMLKGIFDNELLKDESHVYKSQFKKIRDFLNKNIYKNYRPVQELEVVGSEVLRGLLGLFVPVVVPIYISRRENQETCPVEFKLKTHYEKQLLSILPEQFKLSPEKEEKMEEKEIMYEKTIKVVDYVSWMSDPYALDLYRKLKGIDVPRLRNLDV